MVAPIMPFITEEIYQTHFRKNEKEKSVHLLDWPRPGKIGDFSLLEDFYNILAMVRKEKSDASKSMNFEIRLELLNKDYLKLHKAGLLDDLKNVTNTKEIKQGKFKVEFI